MSRGQGFFRAYSVLKFWFEEAFRSEATLKTLTPKHPLFQPFLAHKTFSPPKPSPLDLLRALDHGQHGCPVAFDAEALQLLVLGVPDSPIPPKDYTLNQIQDPYKV